MEWISHKIGVKYHHFSSYQPLADLGHCQLVKFCRSWVFEDSGELVCSVTQQSPLISVQVFELPNLLHCFLYKNDYWHIKNWENIKWIYGIHNPSFYIIDYALKLPKKCKIFFFCEDERAQLYYLWVAYEQVSKTDSGILLQKLSQLFKELQVCLFECLLSIHIWKDTILKQAIQYITQFSFLLPWVKGNKIACFPYQHSQCW